MRFDQEGQIVTPDQRVRVFVSSTLRELAPERAAASEAITALQLTPVLFELGARPHPPQTLYRAYLQQSHLFVGVYWESYGWVGPGESISGIEDEYRLSDGLPRLLYVKEPAPEREPRLLALLERIRAEGSVSYKPFETPEELRRLLARDLALVLSERFRMTARSAAPVEEQPSSSLPTPRTSFVGRTTELEQIEELLAAGTRVLTLTGAGGIGKTRLAVAAARRVAGRYPDGVVFVPLDGVEGAELVPTAIAEALGVRELSGDAVSALAAYLRRRRLLLVLDNFEHLVEAATLVAKVVDTAPGVTALVTSRELLRVTGERELHVSPLSREDEAVELFVERAAAARPGFELTPADTSAVTEICRRLDGVPLAIELAAPRMRLLTPPQLLERLSERLALRGPRDAPERQRTLDAAIAWSYELLGEEERLLFERLGVFHGTFGVEAVEDVGALPGLDVLDPLSSLLDKSVVYRVPHLGETRFAMLRMIREYALERLAASGDLDATVDRHQTYYLRLAGEAEHGLRSESQRLWKRSLDLEADNLRAALGWAAERRRGDEIARLMWGLFLWFWLHGNLDEASEWVARGLASAEGIEEVHRGQLLAVHGTFAVLIGEFDLGVTELGEAEELLARNGDRLGAATAGTVLAFGTAPLEGEGPAQARLARCLAAFEELDDLWGIGTALHSMCRLRVVYDRYEGAGDLFERALETVERVGDELGITLALENLAMSHLAAGDLAAARAVTDRLLEHRRVSGVTYEGDGALDVLARLEHAEGRDERAVALLAGAERLRRRLHTPLWAPALERHERLLAELRESVGDHAFEIAYAQGVALDVDDPHELAQAGVTPPARLHDAAGRNGG